MDKQVASEPEGKINPFHIALLTAALLLPSLLWMVFGWSSFFLPLTVFVLINTYGWKYANNHFLIALPVAFLVAMFFTSHEMMLFAASFIPCGYAIAYGAQRNYTPWISGLIGTIILGFSLTILVKFIMIGADTGFFESLNQSLNSGIDEALKRYNENNNLPAEQYAVLEQTLFQMKMVAPLIMPAIIGSFIIMINWVAVAMGNSILFRLNGRSPWNQYQYWQLPDKLIWLFIAAAIFAILPGEITQTTGINCLLLIALPYIFQGLAIVLFWLNKWKVPRYARIFIYVMIFLQSFGTLLLVIIGIADVWFDIRRIRKEHNKDKINI